jgi:hypothetical protein
MGELFHPMASATFALCPVALPSSPAHAQTHRASGATAIAGQAELAVARCFTSAAHAPSPYLAAAITTAPASSYSVPRVPCAKSGVEHAGERRNPAVEKLASGAEVVQERGSTRPHPWQGLPRREAGGGALTSCACGHGDGCPMAAYSGSGWDRRRGASSVARHGKDDGAAGWGGDGPEETPPTPLVSGQRRAMRGQ